MFAVIFEVEPKPERFDDYLALAAELRPELEGIEGFVANERFRSRERPGRGLSLSIWRDEKAVVRWRSRARHHEAQSRGRAEIFADDHLRVGEVVADSGLAPDAALPQHRFDETEVGVAKYVTLTEFAAGLGVEAADLGTEVGPPRDAPGVVEQQSFVGITDPKKRLLLVGCRDAVAARHWQPAPPATGRRQRMVRIIRDYGLRDRREAPQYHPPVPAGATLA